MTMMHNNSIKKRLLGMLVAIGLASANPCKGQGYFGQGGDYSLNMDYGTGVIQEQSQWCWDACCVNILSYHDVYVSQTDVATWAFGPDNNNQPNYLYGHPNSCDGVLAHFGGIGTTGCLTPISWNSLTNIICSQRDPLIMQWNWSGGGGGHDLVIYGFLFGDSSYPSGNYVLYMDPLEGPVYATYDWVRAAPDGSHTWVYTLTDNSAPGPWAGATPLSGNWRWLQWFWNQAGSGYGPFGYFTPTGNGWILHTEWGYLYADPNQRPNSIWMYSLSHPDLGYWLYTTDSIYPFVYSSSLNKWFFYQIGSGNGTNGWFCDMTTMQWQLL